MEEGMLEYLRDLICGLGKILDEACVVGSSLRGVALVNCKSFILLNAIWKLASSCFSDGRER